MESSCLIHTKVWHLGRIVIAFSVLGVSNKTLRWIMKHNNR